MCPQWCVMVYPARDLPNPALYQTLETTLVSGMSSPTPVNDTIIWFHMKLSTLLSMGAQFSMKSAVARSVALDLQ